MEKFAARSISSQAVQTHDHHQFGNGHGLVLGRKDQRRGEMKVANKRLGPWFFDPV